MMSDSSSSEQQGKPETRKCKCDQGKDHDGPHRCWGSQGAMTFISEAPDVVR